MNASSFFLAPRKKKLGPFLQPEPTSDETGELDSVLERKFVVKDEASAKAVVKMMRSKASAKAVVRMMRSNSTDLSPEFRLLTVVAFRNACLQNKDLTKQLLEEGSAEVMIGANVMDQWNYEAIKNLEHLAKTVEGKEKNWFHATTASFIVMECLQFIWDCLQTEKKEQLIDKKNQLIALHEEYGLKWNQSGYLDDVSTTSATKHNMTTPTEPLLTHCPCS